MGHEGELSVVSVVSSDDPVVDVRVEDAGSGIPKEDMSKLFDLFFSTKDEVS